MLIYRFTAVQRTSYLSPSFQKKLRFRETRLCIQHDVLLSPLSTATLHQLLRPWLWGIRWRIKKQANLVMRDEGVGGQCLMVKRPRPSKPASVYWVCAMQRVYTVTGGASERFQVCRRFRGWWTAGSGWSWDDWRGRRWSYAKKGLTLECFFFTLVGPSQELVGGLKRGYHNPKAPFTP